jgi:YolD-like protein
MSLAKPKKTKKPARPTRDVFELEDLVQQLTEALEEQHELTLFIWQWDEPINGKIEKMDGQTQLIHIRSESVLKKVKFKDILRVER